MGFVDETVVPNGLRLGEAIFTAYLQKNKWTSYVTNVLAGGLRGGAIEGDECREWLFDDSGRPIGIRNYRKRKGENPLQNVSEINFDPTGKITDYTTGDFVKGPKTPDRLYELFGGVRAATGEIYPGVVGDISKEHGYIEDVSEMRRIVSDTAVDYYLEKGKNNATRKLLSGVGPGGMKIYTVEIPVSDDLPFFRLFDPREYDFGLAGKYLKAANWYGMLRPIIEIAKKPLKEAGVKRLDPIYETHMTMSKKFAENAILGPLSLLTYPLTFFLFAKDPKEEKQEMEKQKMLYQYDV